MNYEIRDLEDATRELRNAQRRLERSGHRWAAHKAMRALVAAQKALTRAYARQAREGLHHVAQ